MTNFPKDDDDASANSEAGPGRAGNGRDEGATARDDGADAAEDLRVTLWIIDEKRKLHESLAARDRELYELVGRVGLAASLEDCREVVDHEARGCLLIARINTVWAG